MPFSFMNPTDLPPRGGERNRFPISKSVVLLMVVSVRGAIPYCDSG
jgi:hypothetical protein